MSQSNQVFYRVLAKKTRDQLFQSFFIAFEELHFAFASKIFLLENIDLNRAHCNYLKSKRKIERQLAFFKHLHRISHLVTRLFHDFHGIVNDEIELLYLANRNAFNQMTELESVIQQLREHQFNQYKPPRKSHSKYQKATLRKPSKWAYYTHVFFSFLII